MPSTAFPSSNVLVHAGTARASTLLPGEDPPAAAGVQGTRFLTRQTLTAFAGEQKSDSKEHHLFIFPRNPSTPPAAAAARELQLTD